MRSDIIAALKRKKPQILETWIQNQLQNDSLREDLMSNDELRKQSEELLDSFLENLSGESMDANSEDFEPVIEILSGISITRAKQGYSPRETGFFVFSLRDALLQNLKEEKGISPMDLLEGSIELSKLIDSFGVSTFETFIK